MSYGLLNRICWIIVALSVIGVLVLMAMGCFSPPAGTVYIDTNGDGTLDALAWDRDKDGRPDLLPDGNVAIVAGSGGYKTASVIDATLPEALAALGGLLGIPVLVGVGAAWKGAKFGRIFVNTVMTVQAARQRLKDKGMIEALALVDESLGAQLRETQDAVEKAKEKFAIPSVTDGTG